jgi:hypothetical protein
VWCVSSRMQVHHLTTWHVNHNLVDASSSQFTYHSTRLDDSSPLRFSYKHTIRVYNSTKYTCHSERSLPAVFLGPHRQDLLQQQVDRRAEAHQPAAQRPLLPVAATQHLPSHTCQSVQAKLAAHPGFLYDTSSTTQVSQVFMDAVLRGGWSTIRLQLRKTVNFRTFCKLRRHAECAGRDPGQQPAPLAAAACAVAVLVEREVPQVQVCRRRSSCFLLPHHCHRHIRKALAACRLDRDVVSR